MQLHRCQLPLSNLFALTAYGLRLQGQILPAIILDLARPPSMKLDLRLSPSFLLLPLLFYLSVLLNLFFLATYFIPASLSFVQDEYWIACFVLLSRVRCFEGMLLIRLLDRAILSRPRPDFLRVAYDTFTSNECQAIVQLDSHLQHLALPHLRSQVTQPLLAHHPAAKVASCRKIPRRGCKSPQLERTPPYLTYTCIQFHCTLANAFNITIHTSFPLFRSKPTSPHHSHQYYHKCIAYLVFNTCPPYLSLPCCR